MKYRIIYTIAFYILFTQVAKCQNDTTVFKAHIYVGDTIDLKEKQIYQLFNNISNDDFKYAQYLSVKGNVFLRVTSNDNTYFDYPYKIEDILQDGNLIDKRQSSYSQVIKTNPNQKIYLKIINHSKNTTNYIKEKQMCYITRYSDLDTKYLNGEGTELKHIKKRQGTLVSIVKILNDDNPSIEVVNNSYHSKFHEIIPLNDIKQITSRVSMRNFWGYTLIVTGSVLTLSAFTADEGGAVSADEGGLFIGAIGLGALITGIITVVKQSRKYNTSENTEILIVYK
jgi:hypothetical protein